jgi:very-short-patch-repair endonuclease
MALIPHPFRAAEALDAGLLTYRELRRFHAAVYPGVWVARGADLSASDLARAAWLWSGRRGVLAGLSASALHGARWIEPNDPVELVHTNRRPPRRIVVRGDRLLDGETQTIGDLTVTAPARTGFDLGRRLRPDAAVPRIDALMNATGITAGQIDAVIGRHPRVRGLRNLRTTLRMVDGGAESPYESKTRMLLLHNGFPRPQTQIPVCDPSGVVVARLDMGWRQWQVGVDFDGAHHWTDPDQFTRDVERYAQLAELGWIDIRLTGGMLRDAPQRFLDRVSAALLARGCPRTW